MGGAAIERAGGESDERRPAAVDEPEVDLGLGSAVAMVVVVVACLLLAVLPAAIALQAPALNGGWVGAALSTFVGVVFGLKLVAGAWGVAAGLWEPGSRSHGERELKPPLSRAELVAAPVCAAKEVI